MSYPDDLSNLSTDSENDTTSEDIHPALHNDANAEINAIEAELGTNPSGADSTVKARLEGIEADLSVVQANTQTDNYTLVLTDAGKSIDVNTAGAKAVTVPANASVAFPVGTVVEVTQLGAGQTSIAAAGGVTVNSPDGLLDISAQYGSVSLRKTATDTWVLNGALA